MPGKYIVHELINFKNYLRNHEEFMSFASNQISRLSNMSNFVNPIQLFTSDWPTAPTKHGD